MQPIVRFVFINILLVLFLAFFGGVIGAVLRFFYDDMTRWSSFGYGVLSLILLDYLYHIQKQIIKWSLNDFS